MNTDALFCTQNTDMLREIAIALFAVQQQRIAADRADITRQLRELVKTARLNGLEQCSWLREVLATLPSWPRHGWMNCCPVPKNFSNTPDHFALLRRASSPDEYIALAEQ